MSTYPFKSHTNEKGMFPRRDKPPPEKMTTPSPPHRLSFFIFILLTSGVSSQQFLTSERTILLNLKRRWGNPPTLANWNSTSSPCSWPEVQCRNGSVIVLQLDSKELIGSIPPFICDLRNLENMFLRDNFLTGEFPRVLYNCSNLIELDISQNMFVGRLPDDIDQMSQLKSVDFGANNFTGDIPPAIGNLSSLISLLMYQNLFNGTIPREIGNLSNLETLGLAYNEFANPEIPPEFGKLNSLKVFWMPETKLAGKIPESLSNLVNLELLDLSLNNLEGEIPPGLFLFNHLNNMFLYKNNLTGGIPSTIQSLNLTQIDIAMNKLNGSIPDDFGKLQKLEIFNFYSNQFSGQIPTSICQIPALRIFRVFRNKLTGELPPEFGLHSKLEAFEVSENKLTGKLPEHLCAGGSLTGVIAFSNNLTGEIPRSLESCDRINTIQLYDNSFTGEIPSGIWTLKNISSLRLAGNSFSGKLPAKVAWNLSRLEIDNNRFSGGIPPGISSWVKLNVLKASNNMFSGEIPPEISTLSELTVLYLDGNSLSGELPSEIKSWNSLTILNLARNKLSGQIPSSISSLQDLLELDLSENQFSGEIPQQLSNLRLTSLNLSSNKLTGKIPSAFDNMAYQNSFSNNPNLCATTQISNLHNCFSKKSRSKKFSPKIIALIIVLSTFVVLISILLTLYMFKDYLNKNKKQVRITWKLTSFHKMDFTESNILSCMNESNVIGTGGFGKVYRISVGQPRGYVAVKRLINNKKQDQNLEHEFTSEVQILGSIRHSNIVRLLCCLSSQNSKLLVYEYMVHQSLDKWLHGKKRKPEPVLVPHFVLDWPKRLQIAIGAAQGLCYMHHDCSPPIVHRDVKSSNILLDSEFNAKIADFGLAKILEKQKPGEGVSSIVGSLGYFAPEYAYTTRTNERIDVYSFGVVLLELVTGKEANEGDKDLNLAEWAWKHYGEGDSIVGALDPEIKDPDTYIEQMSTVFKLGLICTSTLPSSRPSMKHVVEILRRCNPLDELPEEMKEGREEFDVAPLLKRESYVTSYRARGKMVNDESDDMINTKV